MVMRGEAMLKKHVGELLFLGGAKDLICRRVENASVFEIEEELCAIYMLSPSLDLRSESSSAF